MAAPKKVNSIRGTDESYGIPKSTLHDRVSGKVVFGAKSGPPAYLNEEEEEIVSFLKACATIGYARSKKTSDITGSM